MAGQLDRYTVSIQVTSRYVQKLPGGETVYFGIIRDRHTAPIQEVHRTGTYATKDEAEQVCADWIEDAYHGAGLI